MILQPRVEDIVPAYGFASSTVISKQATDNSSLLLFFKVYLGVGICSVCVCVCVCLCVCVCVCVCMFACVCMCVQRLEANMEVSSIAVHY